MWRQSSSSFPSILALLFRGMLMVLDGASLIDNTIVATKTLK
jgi:hypothetical protein